MNSPVEFVTILTWYLRLCSSSRQQCSMPCLRRTLLTLSSDNNYTFSFPLSTTWAEQMERDTPWPAATVTSWWHHARDRQWKWFGLFFLYWNDSRCLFEINIKLVLTAGIECKSSIHNLHRIKASAERSTFSNTDIISRYRIARMQSDISRASLLKGNVTFLLESLNYSFASQSFLVADSSRYKAPSFSFLQWEKAFLYKPLMLLLRYTRSQTSPCWTLHLINRLLL